MRYLLCFLLSLILVSCATILNSRYCKTTIMTAVPTTIVVNSDTIELSTHKNNTLILERSNSPKEVILIRNTAVDTIILRPRWSLAYYCNFYSMGCGCLIDGKTPKKWTYPESVYLSKRWIEKNGINYSNEYAGNNKLNLRYSLPHFNWFYSSYEANNEARSNAGFMGVSVGLDYFYNDKTFINISGSGIADIFIPFPAAVDFEGIRDHMFSIYGSVSNNHMLCKNRFSIGYGISYGRDTWNTINHGRWTDDAKDWEIEQESIYRQSNSLGLVLPFYYYTKRSFYMGIVYRPMLIQFDGKARFKYQHTMSFDFGWRIRLIK